MNIKDRKITIRLRCLICGSEDLFESNEDKSVIRCRKCNKIYDGGIEQLKEYNAPYIQEQLEQAKNELADELKNEILKPLINRR